MGKKIKRLWIAALLTSATLIFMTAAAWAETIPVRFANEHTYTRLVFEFPKLLAYHVRTSADVVSMDFDTKASPSALSSIKSPLIKSIKQAPGGDVLKIDMTLASGATVKHYRLQRKIVIDIYPSGPMPKATPEKPKIAEKKTAKPAPEAPKVAAAPVIPVKQEAAPPATAPPEEKKAEVSPVAPTPAPALPVTAVAEPPKPAETSTEASKNISSDQIASQLKDAIANIDTLTAKLPEPPAANAEEETSPDDVTKIRLSFLAPARLAVFTRSNTLWVVTDSTAGTILPLINGPMATFIMPAKTLRFDAGTAYSYILPKKFDVRAMKRSFSWEISLLPESKDLPPLDDMKIAFDHLSRKAKLIASLGGAGAAIVFEDPVVGDTLYVVPTSKADQAIRNTRVLADFEVTPAAVGMVMRPLKDGVTAVPVNDSVIISALTGLDITPEGVGTPVMIGEADTVEDNDNSRLFDFPNWRQGGIRKLQENKMKLQGEISAAATPEDRAGPLMRLAMLYFANHLGQETLGILDLVLSENPEMEKNPDFIAIRGAASAMSGNFKEALQDLSYPAIQQHPEVNLWIGYAAAATEQWRMADRSFPKSNRLLLQYPDNIAIPFTIYMAESALHLGRTETAKKLLDTVNMTSDAMDPQYQAAISYLRGETFAQEGKLDKAEEIWTPVAKGLDRLYHTKASLSLTRLMLQQKKIPLREAVERVDNLRFAWRGDGLEVEVLNMLGTLKVQNNQVLSGLEDMKQAADLSDSILDDSTHIRDDMRRIFADLFVGDQASKIPPLEAVSVYNEFISLLPLGAEGVTASLDFTNYLVHIDLLDKAATIMEDQIKNGISGEQLVSVGTKLSAVYLLNRQPQLALDALRKSEAASTDAKIVEERNLLKARALSQLNQTDTAIGILNAMSSKNAQRLKADVLWRAHDWNAAAAAIEMLLSDAGPSLNEENAQLVVNAAVASKLAGNTTKLREIKAKYDQAMAPTKLYNTFGVVTRDGGISALSDRDSMLKIAGEVDMFKGFLDTYKSGESKTN